MKNEHRGDGSSQHSVRPTVSTFSDHIVISYPVERIRMGDSNFRRSRRSRSDPSISFSHRSSSPQNRISGSRCRRERQTLSCDRGRVWRSDGARLSARIKSCCLSQDRRRRRTHREDDVGLAKVSTNRKIPRRRAVAAPVLPDAISNADAAMSRLVIAAGLKLIVVPIDSTWMRRSLAIGPRARASHASRAPRQQSQSGSLPRAPVKVGRFHA